ncbi:MAG: cupredoxin domain-containing protein [Chloroflexi bacterium]|jgi:plastocyanin|nr:cupredoxin domain-containing protein [Chloroflexota bacterium]HLG50911.1 plastocyanin/azurin family copper-binding protein [Chloroflexota bacterium]
MSRVLSSEPGLGRLTRRGFLASLTVAGVGILAACSSGGGQSSGGASSTPAQNLASGENSSQAPASGNVVVKMTDQNKFDPDTVTISKGQTVTWQNVSSSGHTATFDPSKVANKADVSLPEGVQPFDSGNIDPGQSWSHTFTEAGTYKYTCIPHEALGMHGTVIVK